MCLFPFGGGGMNMQPVVPPTPVGLKHRFRLYVLCVVHLILSIILMFAFSLASGFYDLILVLILYCAAAQMHFCQLLMYIVFILNQLIFSICLLGLVI